MNYRNVDYMIRKLSSDDDKIASKKLSEFYAKARFKLREDDFSRQFTDGRDDGGIDFYHIDGNSFYIFQSKFSRNPKKNNEDEVMHEIFKMVKTLTIENPNRRAEGFVNELRRALSEEKALLEIVWLTTNIVEPSLRESVETKLNDIRREKTWAIKTDFIAIDKNELEGVIFDFAHGFIPQTGKRTVRIQHGKWIDNVNDETNVYSVVCTVNVNDILQWFQDSREIDGFLQKNIRGFLGEKGINEGIEKSYKNTPEWFWFKHNGIIIFADSLEIEKTNKELVMRNPQVVNGGQTLKVLFAAYDRLNRRENSAEILLRAYRIPYHHAETYKISVDIIEALNSQNKILPSDLRSNDPKQVRLQRLLDDREYTYFRKREKGIKSGKFSIPMWKLAPMYYCCKKHAPHSAVAMHVQELFSEESKYKEIFNEAEINREPDGKHVILKYITTWNLYCVLQNRKNDLVKNVGEYFQYVQYFVLADLYAKLMDWKNKKFTMAWKNWLEFVESEEFAKEIWTYARSTFGIGPEIIPKNEEPRRFFRTRQSTQKFDQLTSKRKFTTCMNKAINKFQNRIAR